MPVLKLMMVGGNVSFYSGMALVDTGISASEASTRKRVRRWVANLQGLDAPWDGDIAGR